MLNQGISAVVVEPERRMLITLDLDLYQTAYRIQQSVGNTNWILRAGVLHIAFATLHALGKTIDGSGIDSCTIESGTIHLPLVVEFLVAKNISLQLSSI